MRATFYTDEDALYIKLSDSKFSYGKDLDDRRHLNFSEDDEIIGIEFLQVSDGVDLSDIPEKVKALIDPILAQRHVKVLAQTRGQSFVDLGRMQRPRLITGASMFQELPVKPGQHQKPQCALSPPFDPLGYSHQIPRQSKLPDHNLSSRHPNSGLER